MTTQLFYIYKHTCLINKKSYIGVTNNLKVRTASHKTPTSACPAIRNAIQKYGWENFSTELLCTTSDLNEANLLEEQFISSHRTLVPNGYNLKSGGLYQLWSEHMKLEMSQKRKGVPKSDIHKQKLQQVLIKARQKSVLVNHTDAANKKRSLTLQGRVITAEHRQKTSKAMTGKKKEIRSCTHCGLQASYVNINRWHNDNCKHKPI